MSGHRRTPEGIIKTDIRRYLDSRGIAWNTCRGGAFGKDGDPDIIAVIPPHGLYLAIEGKAPGGTLEHDQEECRDEVLASGGAYLVAYSIEDVAKEIARLQSKRL